VKTVRSEIINIHGSRDDLDDDLPEIQDLVIATDSLPPDDWRRARVFSWMTAFLHFDKLFQLPALIAHETIQSSCRSALARRSAPVRRSQRRSRPSALPVTICGRPPR